MWFTVRAMTATVQGAVSRSVEIAKFDIPTFEAVEHDRSLTQEAGAVVAVTAVVGSLGQLFLGNVWVFVSSIIIMLIGWVVWAWLSAQIAMRFFDKQTTDTGEMLRATGYAYAPQMLGIIPFLWFVGVVWSLAAIIVGMRQAAEMTTGQAIMTALIGAIPAIVAMAIVVAILT